MVPGRAEGSCEPNSAVPQLREHQNMVPDQGSGCVGQDEGGVIKRENNAKIAR